MGRFVGLSEDSMIYEYRLFIFSRVKYQKQHWKLVFLVYITFLLQILEEILFY
jgi:hypothetical protein